MEDNTKRYAGAEGPVYEEEEGGITFKAIGQFFKKVGPMMLVCCLVCVILAGVVCLGMDFVFNRKSKAVQAIIQFSFDGIDEGLDPNGDTFNADSVKSASNVSKVLTDLGLSDTYKVNEVCDALSVDGIVPEDIAKQLALLKQVNSDKPEVLEQIAKLSYHPSRFAITLSNNKVEGMNEKDAKLIVDGLMTQYESYFVEKYGKSNIFATDLYVGNKLEQNDYIEIYDIYYGELSIVRNYLDSMKKKDAIWRSESTNMTFADLIQKLSPVYATLNNFESNITSNGISKNPTHVVYYLQNSKEKLESQLKACENEQQTLRDFMENGYKHPTIIVNGKEDSSNPDELILNTQAYDNMVDKLSGLISQSASLTKQIADVELRIQKFSQQVVSTASEDAEAQAKIQLASINDTMNNLVVLINETVKEYNDVKVVHNAVQQAFSATTVSVDSVSVPWLLALVLGAVLGCVVGIVVAKGVEHSRQVKKAAKPAPKVAQ